MSDVYGYDVQDIEPMGTETFQPSVSVNLGGDDGKIVLTKTEHEGVLAGVDNAVDYRTVVLRLKDQAKQEWLRDSGPDSELGRNMEAGTPTADHSSEPQA